MSPLEEDYEWYRRWFDGERDNGNIPVDARPMTFAEWLGASHAYGPY